MLEILLNSTVNSDACVNRNVNTAEEAIERSLRDAWSALTADRQLFDPVAAPIVDVTPQTLRYDQQLADTIVEAMNNVSGQLAGIAAEIEDCAGSQPGTGPHDSRIGIGADGPWPIFRSVMSELGFLVRELSREAAAGAENLRAAMALLNQADTDAQAVLQSVSALIAADGVSEQLETDNRFWSTTNLIPSAMVGVTYSGFRLQAPTLSITDRFKAGDDWPPTFSLYAGKLPPGLQLEADGTITGTPTRPGDYSFTTLASWTDVDGAVQYRESERTIQVISAGG